VYDSTGNYAYAFIAAIALCAAGAAALLFARPKGESSAAHGSA
jgi:hypothetical protein